MQLTDMKAEEEEDNTHGESVRDYCGEQKYKNQWDSKWCKITTGRTSAASTAHEAQYALLRIATPFLTVDTSVWG